jgi:hypothetical protein
MVVPLRLPVNIYAGRLWRMLTSTVRRASRTATHSLAGFTGSNQRRARLPCWPNPKPNQAFGGMPVRMRLRLSRPLRASGRRVRRSLDVLNQQPRLPHQSPQLPAFLDGLARVETGPRLAKRRFGPAAHSHAPTRPTVASRSRASSMPIRWLLASGRSWPSAASGRVAPQISCVLRPRLPVTASPVGASAGPKIPGPSPAASGVYRRLCVYWGSRSASVVKASGDAHHQDEQGSRKHRQHRQQRARRGSQIRTASAGTDSKPMQIPPCGGC